MKTTVEERLSVAKTIWGQIRSTLSPFEIMSWGVSKRYFDEYEGMPALRLRVSGLLHKGWVYICLNYGTDAYEVYFVNMRGVVKKHLEEVYCDNLGWVLDRHIERGDFTEAEYAKKAVADSNRKMNR